MNEVAVKLTGQQALDGVMVQIDNQPIAFKKNKFGSLVGKYRTSNNKIKIRVFRFIDVGGFAWFITQLFFFLISIFGIFDIHQREKCLIIDYEAEVDLKADNQLTLQLNFPKEDGNAINTQTDLFCREISNKYYLDSQAKRVLGRLKVAKIFLALAIVVTTAAMLLMKI